MPRSTDRYEVVRAIFLQRLAKAWDKAPEMRLGELIISALGEPAAVAVLRHIDDASLAEAVERYVLTRGGGG